MCPDAYSYAFDDQTSTFIIPQGGGFEVVFCPAGRSTTILDTFGDELRQIAQSGHVSRELMSTARDGTYVAEKNDAMSYELSMSPSFMALVVLLAWACFSASWFV